MKLKKIRYCICAVLGVCALALMGNGIRIANQAKANEDSPQAVFDFGDEIESVENNFRFKDYFVGETATGNTDKGLAVFTSTSGATIAYNKTINFNALTADQPIIEAYALYGEGYDKIKNLKYTFYDAVDASNTFSVCFYETTASLKPVYARVEYKGRSVGLGSESSNYHVLMEGTYGCWCPMYGYVGAESMNGAYGGKVRPFAVSIDYAERAVYAYGVSSTNNKNLIIDLDDPTVFSGKDLWKGFTDGIGRVEISFELERKATAGIVLKSIMGGSLNVKLEEASDYPTPTIFVANDEAYAEQMPLCGVGVGYQIPKAYAYDWYFGQLNNLTTEIYAYDNTTGEYSNDKTDSLVDGYFTCDVEGKYRVVYTADNGKNTAVSYLDFEAVASLPNLTIGIEDDFDTPYVLESLYIPESYAYGGSGIISKTEKLFYNGTEIELPQNRTIYLDEAGYLTLRVEAKAYSGLPVVRNFVLNIPDMTALKVEGVPLAIHSGVPTVFPKGYAYDTATGNPVETVITVDGVALDQTLTYTTDKTAGSVHVVYSANERSYAYDLPIMMFSNNIRPSEFFVASQDMQLADENQGVILTANSSGATAYWSYPMVTGIASYTGLVKLLPIQDCSDFDYVDIVLTDYENSTSTAFVRVYTEGDKDNTQAYIQYNGMGEKALVYGSLVNTMARELALEFNAVKGYVYDKYTGNALLQMSGYSARLSKVALRFGNVTGEASVCLAQLGNQEMGSMANRDWKDKAVAVACYDFELNKNDFVNVGEKIQIPNATAYDLCSTVASVSVSVEVKLSDGTKKAVTIDENNEVLCDEFGEYTISFKIKDATNTYTDKFVCRTIDVINPVLTLEYTIKSQVGVGTSIVLPNATATDNIDGNCDVFVYVEYVRDFTKEIVFMGETYTFTQVGKYRIHYVTHDQCANYTRYIIEIEVVRG